METNKEGGDESKRREKFGNEQKGEVNGQEERRGEREHEIEHR